MQTLVVYVVLLCIVTITIGRLCICPYHHYPHYTRVKSSQSLLRTATCQELRVAGWFCWFKWEREREREEKSGAPYCESHLNTTILCHAAILTGLMLNGKELSQKWALPNPLKHDPISDAVLGKVGLSNCIKLLWINIQKWKLYVPMTSYDYLMYLCVTTSPPTALLSWCFGNLSNAECVTVLPTFLDASPFDFGPVWRAALGTSWARARELTLLRITIICRLLHLATGNAWWAFFRQKRKVTDALKWICCKGVSPIILKAHVQDPCII